MLRVRGGVGCGAWPCPRPTFVTPGPGKYADTTEPPFRFLGVRRIQLDAVKWYSHAGCIWNEFPKVSRSGLWHFFFMAWHPWDGPLNLKATF